MPFFLPRLLARLVLMSSSWQTPIVVIVFVFVTSWPLMVLAEPAGSELVEPINYWWYFVVTAATVGYGDFFPETGAGHAVGTYVIVGGIVTLTTVFTKLASVLLADGGCKVVLCAWDEDAATHPMPAQDVDFVRGELTEQDVLCRAGVHRARTVAESLGPVLVDRCQTALGRRHGATVLAARAAGELLVNPPWRTELPAGTVLYYVGPRRLTPEQIMDALDSSQEPPSRP